MPFKSQAQRGFMYSKHPRLANEFEAATPPHADLPEHVAKMAFGGETNPKRETVSAMENNPSAGFAEGGEVSPIAKMIDDLHEKFIRSQGDNGTFPKWEQGIKANKPPALGDKNPNERKGMKEEAGNYASGGEALHQMVNAQDIPAPIGPMGQDAPAPTDEGPGPDAPAQNPSLNDIGLSLNSTPDTNYNFYGQIDADKRAALYKSLLDQQRSPGNLIAQGLGGIGDAFSAAGGKSTDFQNQARGISTENTANRIGAMDTQRQQKMADMEGNQAMMMNDPKHPFAVSLRQAFKQAGIDMPSGMPAGLMLKAGNTMGELGIKQTSLGIQQQVANQNQANQVATRQQSAAKGLQDRSMIQKVKDVFSTSPETAAMQAELPGAKAAPQAGSGHGVPDLGSTFNGGKVLSVKRVD